MERLHKDEVQEEKAQAYRDSMERSVVESRSGIAKRRYGLDRNIAYLAMTGPTEEVIQILLMDVTHLLRLLLHLFWRRWARSICAVSRLLANYSITGVIEVSFLAFDI